MQFYLTRSSEQALNWEIEAAPEPERTPDPDTFLLDDFLSWTLCEFEYERRHYTLAMNRQTRFTLVIPKPLNDALCGKFNDEAGIGQFANVFNACLRIILHELHFTDQAISMFLDISKTPRAFRETSDGMIAALKNACDHCARLVNYIPESTDGCFGAIMLSRGLPNYVWDRDLNDCKGMNWHKSDDAFVTRLIELLPVDPPPITPGAITLKVSLDTGAYQAWRRIKLNPDTTFYELHLTLSDMYNWKSCHTFQFSGSLNIGAEFVIGLPTKQTDEISDARMFAVGAYANRLTEMLYTHGTKPWQRVQIEVEAVESAGQLPKAVFVEGQGLEPSAKINNLHEHISYVKAKFPEAADYVPRGIE